MIELLANIWYNYQLKLALKQGKQTLAKQLLKRLERSRTKLSCLASLYQQQLKSNSSIVHYRQEIGRLTRRLQEITPDDYLLKPHLEFVDYIYRCFQLVEIDPYLTQSTGIDRSAFVNLERELAAYLSAEFDKIPTQIRDREITRALEDIAGLKRGIDPEYSFRLTPHIYFLKYFLENVYCIYLAWFLIYQRGLLKQNLKVLDVAAGVGTSIFSLDLLLSSLNKFSDTSIAQVNYYSLEKQPDLQYRGLQFWRKYVASSTAPLNTYFRFNTVDLFDYDNYNHQIPKQFFDLIIISHCFFYESEQRQRSNQIYGQIFQQNLNHNGRVLLIVQGKKLFNAYDTSVTEDITVEKQLVQMFVGELGLKLDWYKYLSSTGKRTANKVKFHSFAKKNLFVQKNISDLSKTYLQQHYFSHYAIDDYIILAQPNPLKFFDCAEKF